MNTKPGLQIGEHERLAQELKAMYDCLVKIQVQLSAAYPQEIADDAGRAQNYLDRLRLLLDNYYFKEHPDAKHSPYYGPGK